MANYHYYLSEAEKKVAGVSKIKMEVIPAAQTAALLAISYAIMALVKVVAAMPKPEPPPRSYRPFMPSMRREQPPVIKVTPVVKVIDRGSGGIIVFVVLVLIVLVVAVVGIGVWV